MLVKTKHLVGTCEAKVEVEPSETDSENYEEHQKRPRFEAKPPKFIFRYLYLINPFIVHKTLFFESVPLV